MNWQQFWNNRADNPEAGAQVARIISGQIMSNETLAKIANKISEQLELKMEDSLLDICCGNGALSILLMPYCREITGIDFSEKLIALAKINQLPNTHFHFASALDFNLNKNFDKILLYFSFQYFENYHAGKAVIENLLKHAKPGALILIGDIPDRRKFFQFYKTPRRLLQYLKQYLTGSNDMGKFWHPKELDKICNELNVRGEIIEQESWQPYASYRFDYLIRA